MYPAPRIAMSAANEDRDTPSRMRRAFKRALLLPAPPG